MPNSKFNLMRDKIVFKLLIMVLLSNGLVSIGQDTEIIYPKYTASSEKDDHILDGRIPWAIGVHSYGVFRSYNLGGRTHDKDGRGYRFNHHPNIVYWKGHYWVNYQGGPTDAIEGDNPRVPYWISYSENGSGWDAPEILFPSIRFEDDLTYMHTRMGFYVSHSGRLIAISFHGRHKTPNGGGENGVARVGREIYGVKTDGRIEMGPVYALRFNEGKNTENTGLDLYKTSEDDAFVEACDELVNDKLVTQQWFEEDRREELYTVGLSTKNSGPDASTEENIEAKAFDWYSLPSGRVVGWWKGSAMAYSDDNWKTTGDVSVDFNRFNEHRTAKMWGQRLSNDTYAMVYSLGTQSHNPPTEWSWTRSPLVVASSVNGLHYNKDRAVVFGDIAPTRYINPPVAGGLNDNRDGGPQYIRGISESNTNKPNTKEPTGNMWLTFSVNKEDIWVSEVPYEIRSETKVYPKDDFETYSSNNLFGDWIVLSPAWAPISLEKQNSNQFMRFQDKDPYDFAKAMRVFPASDKTEITFKIRAGQISHGLAAIDITDKHGRVAARLQLAEGGKITSYNGASPEIVESYTTDEWIQVHVKLDVKKQQYTLTINGQKSKGVYSFYEGTAKLERFELRTGKYRLDDFSRIGTWGDYSSTTLPNADNAELNAVFDLDNLIIQESR